MSALVIISVDELYLLSPIAGLASGDFLIVHCRACINTILRWYWHCFASRRPSRRPRREAARVWCVLLLLLLLLLWLLLILLLFFYVYVYVYFYSYFYFYFYV